MPKIQIGQIPFFCMMVLFLFGTAVLLDIGSGAMQDAWLVSLISPLFGGAVFYLYYYLFTKFPDKSLIEYTKIIWGKYLGSIVGFFYIIYFIYIAARVLRDFLEMLVISPYFRTSMTTLGICIILVLIYAVNLGIEVFSRVAVICFVIMLVSLFVINTMYVIGGYITPDNIVPVLSNGLKPIIHEVFPLGITVPYGELITFTMLLPYINNKKKVMKTGLFAIACTGLYLTFNMLMLICVIGPDLIIRSAFPSLTAVSNINIGDFIQRLDPFIITLMVILGFVKITTFFFCGVMGINQLFSMKPHVVINYSVGGMILFFSIIIASTYQEHLKEGLDIVPYYLHIPFQIVIPFSLLLTLLMKEKILKKPYKAQST
ncbi:GerAB/ArcD/ProY family transporter [Metabacillus niabensis]|uniref:GerAB/ArcD/ProY family transporter n=1 Tax=Metabacillus niabensis TaxID=324854 RepID=UPI001CFAE861|nr:GerAB/ArcD/ProY family transporter [Metabacillus niabensis]